MLLLINNIKVLNYITYRNYSKAMFSRWYILFLYKFFWQRFGTCFRVGRTKD